MVIHDIMRDKGLSVYKLSKDSGVPMTTVADICSGKSNISKCSVGTVYKLAKVLEVSIESLMETKVYESDDTSRSTFGVFKSAVCHTLKTEGDVGFILKVLECDEIRENFDKGWYAEALYLLAMVDYISRQYDIPLCTKYEDIRKCKLEKPLYPMGVLLTAELCDNAEILESSEKEAIPEFKRFNIIESDVQGQKH